MKRYKQANEGIHAPEETKERAARPAGKRSYARWRGAVAAVLAVVLIGGAVLWPGRSNVPDPMSLDEPRGIGLAPATDPIPYAAARANALAAVVYPEMAPYPKEEDFISSVTGAFDYNKYDSAYDAWRENREALRSGMDYTGLMDSFLSASTAQFLTGAGSENRVYSPLNVYMALSMLAETTGGNSREQLLDLLGADSVETLRTRANALWRDHYRDDGVVTSLLANSLWLNENLDGHYVQDTLDTMAQDYYAGSFSGEMGSEEYNQALRSWINEQTRGLLKDAAGGLEMDPSTVLALASTVYFKAGWASKFEEANTREDIFHTPSGDLTVDFMHSSRTQTYYWSDRFSAVSLDFEGREYRMWLILPDEGYAPDDLLASGEAVEFLLADKYHYADSKYLTVHLSMPKFDVSSSTDLIEGLKELGVTDIFDYSVSDFTLLTDLPEIYVSQAVHAARVIADEEQVEAAGFTVIGMEPGSALPPTDEVDFILDRPFIFAITGDSGLPLFTGVVNEPNG